MPWRRTFRRNTRRVSRRRAPRDPEGGNRPGRVVTRRGLERQGPELRAPPPNVRRTDGSRFRPTLSTGYAQGGRHVLERGGRPTARPDDGRGATLHSGWQRPSRRERREAWRPPKRDVSHAPRRGRERGRSRRATTTRAPGRAGLVMNSLALCLRRAKSRRKGGQHHVQHHVESVCTMKCGVGRFPASKSDRLSVPMDGIGIVDLDGVHGEFGDAIRHVGCPRRRSTLISDWRTIGKRRPRCTKARICRRVIRNRQTLGTCLPVDDVRHMLPPHGRILATSAWRCRGATVMSVRSVT